MIRNVFIAALAGSAIIAVPAAAKPGATSGPVNVGASAGMNAGMNARVNSQGSLNASTNATTHANANSAVNSTANTNAGANARVNSQGPTHASTTGISHANEHSVLASGSVQASTLPGLTTGLTVNNSSGTAIGTVTQVVTGTNGTIRMVIVTSSTGQTYRLPASSLSISGGVVTTTSVTGG